MRIEKYEARPQNKPPQEWFYGVVFQEPIIEAPQPARNRSLKVLFEAGHERPGILILWVKLYTFCQV